MFKKKEIIKKIVSILMCTTLVIAMAGCNKTEERDSAKVQIVATLFPQYDFAKQIGYEEGNVPEDLYIGIRKPTKTLSSDKTTQDNYDLAVRTLQNIIDDLSK